MILVSPCLGLELIQSQNILLQCASNLNIILLDELCGMETFKRLNGGFCSGNMRKNTCLLLLFAS